MNSYEPSKIEQKWQKKWEEAKLFEVDLKQAEEPYFAHVMFPYPSGDRLHIGHWYNYAPADSHARFMRMQGKDVFTPMGFDSFGLPAENYAIKTGVHPKESTAKNIENMIAQLKRIGTMYDWSKMVNTSNPAYYKWTQWLFLQMYKQGLAYKKTGYVNWCPKDQTVLANEQVWEGKCERCDTEVVQKPLTQWYWKTTAYAQELLDELENLDWPEKTKLMQKHWIGRSEGVTIKSKIKGTDIPFAAFDSVPQTYMAQTFAVMAPEHPILPDLISGTDKEEEIHAFIESVRKKKAAGTFNIEEDMEGMFTGLYVEDPYGTGDLPIWLASFVVADYGTGMVVCSAHDERDFAFAKKYNIPLRPVMFPEHPEEAEKVRNLEVCYCKEEEGVLEKPEQFKGRKWGEVRNDIIEHLEKEGIGEKTIQYKLRDWTLSRQRYWGAPIPVVYDPEGNPHLITEEHLPWTLPDDVDFNPHGTAPLATSKELLERTEKIFGKGWTPEVDTMDTFVCSSYYSFMYLCHPTLAEGVDPPKEPFMKTQIEKKWMPVEMYIGGPEHACMHLIYARFVTKALRDGGHVTVSEPFQRLVHQGLITNQGAKMSKSKGNVVSPDSFVEQYGSDVFRMYLMFMGPFTDGGDWSDTGIKGVDRFVKRIWKIATEKMKKEHEDSSDVIAKLHATIKKVGADIDRMHFNTALAALMECTNLFEKQEVISTQTIQTFAKLFAPLAPHLAEEIWEKTGGEGFIMNQEWPEFDEAKLMADTMTIVVQVNGKVRASMTVDSGASKEEILALAKEEGNVQKHLSGEIKKEIYVPGKLVSIVL